MSGRSPKSSKARSKSTFTPTPIGLRELLDASPDAIFCCDLDGRWNWLSPAIESFTGLKPGDLLDHFCTEVVSPHERFRLMRDFARLRRRKQELPHECSVTLLRQDGSEMCVMARVRLIERVDGDRVFVGVMREAHGASGPAPGLVNPGYGMGVPSMSGASGMMAGAPVASGEDGQWQREHRIHERLMAEVRAQANAEANVRVFELETRIADLSSELDQARAEVGDAAASLELLRHELEQAGAAARARQEQIESLLGELELARTQARDSSALLEPLRGEVEQSRARADAAQAEATAALEQARQAQAESEALKLKAHDERLAAEQMLADAEEARADERRSRTEMMQARDAAVKERTAAEMRAETSAVNEAAAVALVDGLRDKLEATAKELAALKKSHGAKPDGRARKTEQRIAELEDDLARAVRDAEAARIESKASRIQLQDELEAVHSELNALRPESARVRAERDNAQAELANLANRNLVEATDTAQMRSDLETERATRAAIEAELAHMRSAGGAMANAAMAAGVGDARVPELEHRIEALERLLESAQARGTEWTEFLATLSHEIRTPMNGVIGMSHLLLDTGLDAQQRSWVEIIRHSAHALLALINNSLDFSRLEAGHLEIEEVDFDLRVTVNEVHAVLMPIARERNLTLSCQVHHEVPSRLRGDAGRLRQVLLNVMRTAMRCTDGGDVKLTIDRLDENEEVVSLVFRVNGTSVGAAEDHMLNMFEAFVQSDVAIARKHGADGLGLAVARQLVTLLHGEIGMDSAAAAGTTPWFRMRIDKQPEVTSMSETPTVRLRGLRVMVVDGSRAARTALVEMLGAWGSRADEAANAEEAIDRMSRAHAAKDPYQVAIIDMELPGSNGEELGGRMHAIPELSATRTMLLTSVGRRGDAARVQGLGFAAYLIKPIEWTELYDALTEVVQAHPANASATLVTRHSIAESRRNRVRILLVDDDPVNQLVTDWTLRRHGYTTERAGTASRALEMFDLQRPDLILLDIALPDVDGYKVVQSIRAREQQSGHHTPVIAVTGKIMPGDRARCLAAGMDDYLSKPLDLAELCEVVERWTARDRQGALAATGSEIATPGEAAAIAAMSESDAEHKPSIASMIVPPPDPTHVPKAATGGPRRVPMLAPTLDAGDDDTDRPLSLAAEDEFTMHSRPQNPPRLSLVKGEQQALEAGSNGTGDPGIELVSDSDIEITPSRAAIAPVSGTAPGGDGDGFVLEKAPDRGVFGALGNDPSVLDVKRLDDASMGIPALREALLNTFMNDLQPRLDRMDLAILNHASLKLEHEAHGLRGMAATIGAIGCAAVFMEIERIAHEDRSDGLNELMDAARREARKIEDHLLTIGFRGKRVA